MRIAIDGPASSGKSTVAKLLAKKLGFVYLDTGAMYRCMTLALLRQNMDLADEESVVDFVKKQSIQFERVGDKQFVYLNGQDVTEDIRQPDVSQNVSLVSSYKDVRADLVERQRQYIQQGGIIMDGRDIGTVVMPEAELKIFMVASAYERAKRRYLEHMERGIATESIENLQREIEARDLFDSTRSQSPLKKAEDAIELDTTTLTIEEVVNVVFNLVNQIKLVPK